MRESKENGDVGRPRRLDHEKIRKVLIEHKDEIIIDDADILAQGDELWSTITTEIGDRQWNEKEPKKDAYSYVVNNVGGIREILCPNFVKKKKPQGKRKENLIDSLVLNSTLDSSYDYGSELVFRVGLSIFYNLVEEKTMRVNNSKRMKTRTEYHINLDEFKEFMDQKLREHTRRSCNYDYKKKSYKHKNIEGRIKGICRCESKINCFFTKDGKIMVIRCEMKDGETKDPCGKRNITQSSITNDSSRLNRTKNKVPSSSQTRDDILGEEESSSSTHYLHPSAIISVEILKQTTMKNDIRNVRRHPIEVAVCSPYQRTIYKTLMKDPNTVIVILVDNSIIKPMKRVTDEISDQINYFQVVVMSPKGQSSVNQLFSESNETYLFVDWLIQWIEYSKLQSPEKIIVQGMVELVNGCIQAFTKVKTLTDYVETFGPNLNSPPCLIRVDPRTILRKYALMMSNFQHRDVAVFLLVGLGKLLLSNTLQDAETIARALFTITLSDNQGMGTDGSRSSCDVSKKLLQKYKCDLYADFGMAQTSIFEFSEAEKILSDKLRIKVDDSLNYWPQWSLRLKEEAVKDIEECPGSIASRYHVICFAKELEQDLRYFPLLTSIHEVLHTTGKVQILVEKAKQEIENIKEILESQHSLPVRLDEFIQIHKSYIDNETGHSESPDAGDSGTCDPGRDAESGTNLEDKCISCGQIFLNSIKCCMCDRSVHPGSPCSVPIPSHEDMYGIPRVCRSCSKKPSVHKMIASNHFENWRNQVVTHQATKRRKKKHQDSLPVLLLKNNLSKLRNYTSNEEKIMIHYACSFDSLAQLFLSAAHVSGPFKNQAERNVNRNLFMRFISDTTKCKITPVTFYQRFKLLEGLFGHRKTTDEATGLQQMKCDSACVETAETLLYSVPSYLTNFSCSNGCDIESEASVIISLPRSTVIPGPVNWTTLFPMMTEKCKNTDTCITTCSYDMSYVMLDTFGHDDNTVTLEEIPHTLQFPGLEHELHLMGFINYQPPQETASLNDEDQPPIGHYTAYCVNNGDWIEYDDAKMIDRYPPDEVRPILLLYCPIVQ